MILGSGSVLRVIWYLMLHQSYVYLNYTFLFHVFFVVIRPYELRNFI